MDHCGRKIAIIVTAAVFVVGALILALANSYPVLVSTIIVLFSFCIFGYFTL